MNAATIKLIIPNAKVVAATIIQWLGSPVGNSFVQEVLNSDISKSETIQAQYYSHMDFDYETVGWTSVDNRINHETRMQAIEAIQEHRKSYPAAKDREFRIVTKITTTIIEDIK